jgi:hypothetical protein
MWNYKRMQFKMSVPDCMPVHFLTGTFCVDTNMHVDLNLASFFYTSPTCLPAKAIGGWTFAPSGLMDAPSLGTKLPLECGFFLCQS